MYVSCTSETVGCRYCSTCTCSYRNKSSR